MVEDQEFTLPPLEERPLVTFALFAYNQEKYIREAIEGAFAQTYEPLEIILSDDFSTDRTFEIMKEMAFHYKGPHQVRVNRNDKNMGIAPHVHKIDQEAKGELILHAAGDDISLPERTNKIVEKWLSFEHSPSVIVSNALIIDSEEITNETIVSTEHKNCFINGIENKFYSVLGCSLAVSKSLIKIFNTIDERIIAEDVVLYRRAELLNGIYYIQKPLVKWRRHNSSIMHSWTGSKSNYLNWEKKWTNDALLRVAQADADRRKLNLPGASYSSAYKNFLKLKQFALKSNPINASSLLLLALINKDISFSEAKDVAKIIFVRIGIIKP